MLFLLDLGADVNAKDNKGKTPLHHAVAGVRMSFDRASQILPLLIDHGADVNARDNEGKTPLHHLVRDLRPDQDIDIDDIDVNSYVAIMLLLITLGADVHAKDNLGLTPLDYITEKIVF